MTKVTFENATIRDVIGKAARVAPTKGSAFDKASGILMEIDAENNEVTVRATNIEVFYMEVVDAVAIEGVSRVWRIPSSYIDGICAKLPITSGSSVTFDDENGNQLKVATGRMRATMRLADVSYYPSWDAFDPAQLSPAPDFAARLNQVQWAASKAGVPPLTGIHLDGQKAMATDQFRVAMTPCPIPQLYEPVTIPSTVLAPLMKSLGDVRIGQEGGHLLLMPDESTQIRTVLFDGKYPNIEKVVTRDESNAIMVRKTAVLEMIERAMVMGQRDRTPLLKVIIGLGELAVMMEDREIGLLGDVYEIEGQAPHDRHYIGFTPENVSAALQAAPNEEVSIYYHLGKPMKPVRLDGGSGYEVLVMPRDLRKGSDDS